MLRCPYWLFIIYRVLPRQPQKTLDTDLSAPECPGNVRIYQVIRKILIEVWRNVYPPQGRILFVFPTGCAG